MNERFERSDALDYLAEADETDRRIVAEIRRGDHETISEIAQAVGISRFQLYRRIEKMRKTLKKEGWE